MSFRWLFHFILPLSFPSINSSNSLDHWPTKWVVYSLCLCHVYLSPRREVRAAARRCSWCREPRSSRPRCHIHSHTQHHLQLARLLLLVWWWWLLWWAALSFSLVYFCHGKITPQWAIWNEWSANDGKNWDIIANRAVPLSGSVAATF